MLDASAAGMRSIEHLGPAPGVLMACSREGEALRRPQSGPPAKVMAVVSRIPYIDEIAGYLLGDVVVNPMTSRSDDEIDRIARLLAGYDEPLCREAARQFVATDTWQVPTLIRSRTTRLGFSKEFQQNPNLRDVAPSELARWKKTSAKYDASLSAQDKEILRASEDLQFKIVKLMDEEGVRMLTGSDSVGGAWLVPGFSLHEEFDLLAKAGLSPLKILQMATLNAAAFLGKRSTMGSTESGKVADLVLLDAEPTASDHCPCSSKLSVSFCRSAHATKAIAIGMETAARTVPVTCMPAAKRCVP